MSKEPGREQNWYPVSKLGWFTGHIREGVETTCRQLELLQPARARPNVLDDATVARIIRVHRDQAGDLTLFQNQAGRRKTDRGLTGAQRAGIAAYETLITQLRQVKHRRPGRGRRTLARHHRDGAGQIRPAARSRGAARRRPA